MARGWMSGGIPPTAAALGYAGALPFIAGASSVWLLPSAAAVWGGYALLAYGAVILSFLGGIQWGLATNAGGAGEPDSRRLIVSVLPSLIGWTALLGPIGTGLLWLGVGFVAQYVYDRQVARRGWAPPWFGVLRLRLTVIVTVCIVCAAPAFLFA